MNVFEFGDAKLKLRDIDPLYTALHGANLSLAQRQRYTLAEVSFDHAGVAARITQAPSGKFWAMMLEAAGNKLRGAPRRYFFPKEAATSIKVLAARYGTGEKAIAALQGTFSDVSREMKYWPYFGPCAIFKLADMAERVCGNRIDFSFTTWKEIASNGQVLKGLDKVATEHGWSREDVIDRMQKYKWATRASPAYDRKLNAQEFETILCYYSHDDAHNKHMPGMDSPGIESELRGYGTLADKLITHLPHNRR